MATNNLGGEISVLSEDFKEDWPCECSPIFRDGHEFNHFIAFRFSECVYSFLEILSFYIGMSSLIFWILCQMPQFYKNYLKKSGNALSKWFLIEWFSGDALNLVGCIMTKQLATQLATSILFVIVDVFMLVQIFYYQCYFDHDAYHKSHHHGSYSTGGGSLKMVAAKNRSAQEGTALEPLLGKEKSNKTARLKELDVEAIEKEAEAEFQHSHAHHGKTTALAAVLAPITLFSIFSFAYNSNANPRRLFDDQLVGLVRKEVSIDLPDCEPHQEVSEFSQHLGYILGWVSAIVYLNSRVPQIIKNYKRKSVEGLSLIMFFCAVMGNTTYGLGVILKDASPEALSKSFPWLVGSLGTLGMDFFIVLQFYYYRDSRKEDALLKVHSYAHAKIIAKQKRKRLKQKMQLAITGGIPTGKTAEQNYSDSEESDSNDELRSRTPIRGLFGMQAWTTSPLLRPRSDYGNYASLGKDDGYDEISDEDTETEANVNEHDRELDHEY